MVKYDIVPFIIKNRLGFYGPFLPLDDLLADGVTYPGPEVFSFLVHTLDDLE